MRKLCSFVLTFFCLQLIVAQESAWFRTKYFNQGKEMVFLDNPYSKLPTNENEFLPIIEITNLGITIYNKSGPANFSINTGKFILNDGGSIRELHTSITSERQAYFVELEKPLGLHRGLYDTICSVKTQTVSSWYYLKFIARNTSQQQEVDNRLSLNINKIEVIAKSPISERYSALSNLIVVDGVKLHLGINDTFKLKIIRGNKSSRHYIIEDNGCELIVKQNGSQYSCLLSFPDGGLVRFHGGQ
jgi:hypothetical protein